MFLENLDQLFEEYLKEKKYLKNIARNTELNYRQSFTAFKKYSSKEISKNALNKWIVSMREAEITPKSCNTMISAMNTFLHWLYECEIIPSRIDAKRLKLPNTVPTALTEETVLKLANYKPKHPGQFRTHAILSLLIDTGMRIDEALGARVKDVDLDQSLITVTGKGSKVRIIPISFEMRKRIFLWLKKRGDNPCPFLFPTATFNRMEYHNFRRDLHVILKTLKLTERIHAHAFRHFFAISFLRKGGDLFRLSRILGHANISVTEIYLQTMPTVAITEAHRQFSPLVQN